MSTDLIATEYEAALESGDGPGANGAPRIPTRIEVLAAGALSTLQDRGRPGMGGLGVGVSGAADPPAAGLANRLVGNLDTAAVIEVTFGGLRFRVRGRTTFAVTGAIVPVTIRRASGGIRAEACYSVLGLSDGDEVLLGAPASGLRSYVALRGGVEARQVLGSRSTDLLSELGPAPLAAGQEFPLGADCDRWPSTDAAAPGFAEKPVPVLDVIFGPRDDWFDEASRELLLSQEWEVTAASNRVGARLSGATPLARVREGELPSEGMVPGSLQVPPNGQLVLFMADHPVTGGYPVIGVVPLADVYRAAQMPPGRKIRFRERPSPL